MLRRPEAAKTFLLTGGKVRGRKPIFPVEHWKALSVFNKSNKKQEP